MNAASTISLPMAGNRDDTGYRSFLAAMQARFLRNIGNPMKPGDIVRPLFTTNAAGLFDAYLNAFPESDRQYHNCNACRHFIERYAGLVTLDDRGNAEPAILFAADAPTGSHEKNAIRSMISTIRGSAVTGVFLSSEWEWGTAQTGEWSHMAVTPPSCFVHKSRTKTAHQAMAEKAEGIKTVRTFLSEYRDDAFFQAYQFCKSDALYRAEKVLGQAEWLWKLKVATKIGQSRIKDNILWLAVATAPEGFLHPRASMIGTLIADIAAGLSLNDVAAKFRDKMDPMQYQRPTASPAARATTGCPAVAASICSLAMPAPTS